MFNNIIQAKYIPLLLSGLGFLSLIHYSIPIVILIYVGSAYLIHNYQRGPIRNYQDVNLEGKIVIITGASAGIGKETAKKLALHKATVVFACRDKEKTQRVITEIATQTGNKNLFYENLILDDYKNVQQFVQNFKQRFKKVDILINNAGIAQWWHKFTKYNHELVFATNHLGHFLLTNLLLDCFAPQSRIIVVSSVMHEMIRSRIDFEKAIQGKYLENYNITKYCGVLYASKLSKMVKNTKVVSLHPGVIKTELLDKAGNTIVLQAIQKLIFWLFRPMTLSLEEGAQTTIYCSLQPYNELVNGGYYQRNKLSKCSKYVELLNQHEELWNFSTNILKEYL